MLRWLYPTTCALCHESSDTCLCESCREKLPRVPRPICLTCGSPVLSGQSSAHSCPHCEGKSRTYGLARSALMMTGAVSRLLHDFKYHHAGYLAPAFALLLEEVWQQTPFFARYDDWVLTPVPVTRSRLYERGYNQAEELARALGKRLSLRVQPMLERLSVEGGRSQTHLSSAARQRNAFTSFRVRPELMEADGEESLPSRVLHLPSRMLRFSSRVLRLSSGALRLPPRVLLVDDVYTTGATARACSRLLSKLPGVEQVGVLTLVRAMSLPAEAGETTAAPGEKAAV